jgi:glycosyltransferase involved in cell wall biosynthesis
MKISIIIPTYNRPDLFRECINSCLFQSLLPYEIIIGDDSSNDDTKKMIEQIIKDNPTIKITYFKHLKQKKQIWNLNFLIDKVQGDYVILIHDDDYLLENCLSDLSKPILNNPSIDASFGKQYLVDAAGYIDKKKSDLVNEEYYRTAFYEGSVLTSYQSGILQQFPNNSYLIKADLIKKYPYSTDYEFVGDACDYFFSFNLGLKKLKFHFVNIYTAAYRIGNEKVSNNSRCDAALKGFLFISVSAVPEGECNKSCHKQLKKFAPLALVQAINRKEKRNAFNIFFSQYHFAHLFSLGGAKRSLLFLKLMIKIN